ncbi:hypothetical protein VTO42DRAFT_8975 [Malbranchea cinnamomea]
MDPTTVGSTLELNDTLFMAGSKYQSNLGSDREELMATRLWIGRSSKVGLSMKGVKSGHSNDRKTNHRLTGR